MNEKILVEKHGHITVLKFSDPARKNAMHADMGHALQRAVAAVDADPNCRVVVLTGAGGTFSAGGDLAMLESLSREEEAKARAFMEEFYARFLSLRKLPVPTIAAVEGAAVGAGLCVALACDLMVVDANAKLALNFVKIGIHPGMGGTYFLRQRIGELRARELLLTGRFFSGAEAIAYGLALPANESGVFATALALAESIAKAAPLPVRGITQALRSDLPELARMLDDEATHQAHSYGTQDFLEGISAIREKRTPNFENR